MTTAQALTGRDEPVTPTRALPTVSRAEVLGAMPHGLSSGEVAARLAQAGPNRIPQPRHPAAWRRLFVEFVHFFAVMLWIAGGLAFVAGMPQLGVAIFVVVVVNGLFAFVQERRAEHATERLRDLMPVRVTVRRNGVTTSIEATGLVVGDIVLLAPGDRVAADLAVVEADDATIDASMLTGESVAVPLLAGGRAWGGTFVVGGEAVCSVESTGADTRLAGIAALTAAAQRPQSPLATELARVVRTIGAMAVGVGMAFFALSLVLGTAPRNGFLFAVGVTVALVPEGLLPTVTLSLAMGAQRMARRHALVRHLEAVETLGSTTFICTDKTGTLTRNEMSVVEAWTPAGAVTVEGVGYEPIGVVRATPPARAAAMVAAAAAMATSQGRATVHGGAWVAQGDPMEAAIDAFAHRLVLHLAEQRIGHLDADADAAAPVRRFSFDPVRRRASALTTEWLLVKGAPDSVIPRCVQPANAADAAEAMASRGLRVLAMARRPAADVTPGATADDAERDLEFLGLVGLHDPPRPEAHAAIAACRRAGIKLAMVTGDHPSTARAIGRQVGLFHDAGRVLRADELPDDDGELGDLLDHDGVVLSRVSPEDKLRIARVLQARGHVVAMTGDGVNDGPALREADIGIAMGLSGTDVAREAADLVLLDDDFATIVAAIEQGRATYSNIRRFLTYHLTDNVAELTPFVVWALSGGNIPLALGVLQILCLDIGTDLLPALALGAEAPTDRALASPPIGRHLIDRQVVVRVFAVLGPTEAIVEMAAFFASFAAAGWRPGNPIPEGSALLAASGAAFSAVVIGQAANVFACRSTTKTPYELGWTSNRLIVAAVLIELVALAGFLLVAPVADLLAHAAPPPAGFVVALAAAPAVVVVDWAYKSWRRIRRTVEPAAIDAE
jgi:magnesium-transporting ATPase (P-type)